MAKNVARATPERAPTRPGRCTRDSIVVGYATDDAASRPFAVFGLGQPSCLLVCEPVRVSLGRAPVVLTSTLNVVSELVEEHVVQIELANTRFGKLHEARAALVRELHAGPRVFLSRAWFRRPMQ